VDHLFSVRRPAAERGGKATSAILAERHGERKGMRKLVRKRHPLSRKGVHLKRRLRKKIAGLQMLRSPQDEQIRREFKSIHSLQKKRGVRKKIAGSDPEAEGEVIGDLATRRRTRRAAALYMLRYQSAQGGEKKKGRLRAAKKI